MRRRARNRVDSAGGCQLVEVITPRTNRTTLTAAENFLAGVSIREPFSLEIAATHEARRFLLRAGSAAMRSHLQAQLLAAYPQAEVRPMDIAHEPGLDPAELRGGEQVAACTLVLKGPAYLPLRTFADADLAGEASAQADPVLGLLNALGDLPQGWRSLSQVVLRPAAEEWCEPYLRLAVEHPLAAEQAGEKASLVDVYAMAGLLVAVVFGLQAYRWVRAADWLRLGLLVAGILLAVPVLIGLGRKLAGRPIYEPRRVQEKISRPAYLAELRLAVFAPLRVSAFEVETQLERAASAYRQFSLASGNGLQPRAFRLAGRSLAALAPLNTGLLRSPLPLLNTRELAGLWHLPHADADIPLLERTTARVWLPRPLSLPRGCRIGVSSLQGREVPVFLPDDLLRRHLLLVAKTRRGKSSLMLCLAHYLMAEPQFRRTLLLVDPHRDLARTALGLVPEPRRDEVVYLDVSEPRRPFGLNLLDTGLGWDRDQAVSSLLTVFEREFDRFWGPRMEDAFRFAALTLYAANERLCAADPDGRNRQYTVLDVPPLLSEAPFRRTVLELISDPVLQHWWSSYFDRLDYRLQLEVINPVQTKVQRFAGSRVARRIVGQPRSTVDPGQWLASGAIVVVNTAKGLIGEDASALIGGTLLNLVALAIARQAGLDPGSRHPVTILVDEFHCLPGADYEGILSELGKYGANLVLATQSLARLDALDRESRRALRAMVFANVDALFAFHTSAEDAQYLVPELGGAVEAADLVELADYACYVRLSSRGTRLPPFSVRLDPPPAGDPGREAQLAAQSAAEYGRDGSRVDRDLAAALARIENARDRLRNRPPAPATRGVPKSPPPGTTPQETPRRARNESRPHKQKTGEAH